jgi:hypothetical protein
MFLLIYAAKKGQVTIVEQLLLAGADIEAKDEVTDNIRREESASV